MIIARAEWGASSRSLPAATMGLPAEAVFLHHSVTPVTGDPAADMRTIESIGLQRFGQYSYSYAIHPHNGEILEGCGLRRGAHTAGRNSTSFGICWVGDYTTRAPKVQQIDATRWLIHHLKTQGHLIPDAIVRGHRDVMATACPGAKLYAVLGDIRRPWEEPTAPPPVLPPSPVYDYEEAATKTTMVHVGKLDSNGNGHADWQPGLGRDPIIVGLVQQGPSPPDDGYWPQQAKVNLSAQPRGGAVRVVVRNGTPGDTVTAWVTVA
jgi:N-acetylmuramoyl-L-alanine amidase